MLLLCELRFSFRCFCRKYTSRFVLVAWHYNLIFLFFCLVCSVFLLQFGFILCCVQVADVKKNIETAQGASVYPAEQQMLIYQGKVLKDDTTLGENKVAENSFVVIMLSKVRFVSLVCSF